MRRGLGIIGNKSGSAGVQLFPHMGHSALSLDFRALLHRQAQKSGARCCLLTDPLATHASLFGATKLIVFFGTNRAFSPPWRFSGDEHRSLPLHAMKQNRPNVCAPLRGHRVGNPLKRPASLFPSVRAGRHFPYPLLPSFNNTGRSKRRQSL